MSNNGRRYSQSQKNEIVDFFIVNGYTSTRKKYNISTSTIKRWYDKYLNTQMITDPEDEEYEESEQDRQYQQIYDEAINHIRQVHQRVELMKFRNVLGDHPDMSNPIVQKLIRIFNLPIGPQGWED